MCTRGNGVARKDVHAHGLQIQHWKCGERIGRSVRSLGEYLGREGDPSVRERGLDQQRGGEVAQRLGKGSENVALLERDVERCVSESALEVRGVGKCQRVNDRGQETRLLAATRRREFHRPARNESAST